MCPDAPGYGPELKWTCACTDSMWSCTSVPYTHAVCPEPSDAGVDLSDVADLNDQPDGVEQD